jgi:hypothetical protein
VTIPNTNVPVGFSNARETTVSSGLSKSSSSIHGAPASRGWMPTNSDEELDVTVSVPFRGESR